MVDNLKRFNAISAAIEAIETADELTPVEKRVAIASLRYRPLVRMRAVRLVSEEAQRVGAVDAEGHVAAGFDWVELLKILLPILLALL